MYLLNTTMHLAKTLGAGGPSIIAVNPASLLASKMVKEAFGIEGKDVRIGADILVRAALSVDFANASGLYYDNDSGQFAQPHPAGMDASENERLTLAVEDLIDQISS